MQLEELLGEALAAPSLAISDLQLDSRRCASGSLFLAIPGHRVDGRQYISQALAQGASAVLLHTDQAAEHGQIDGQQDRPVIAFYRLAQRLGELAARFYGRPSRRLSLVGITGTNGKTTTSQIIGALLDALDQRCGVIGTLGNGLYGQLSETANTTPDAITLQRELAGFVDAGATTCAMEVSSHALVQQRVTGAEFDIAVFTNLSRDHLDYHGDMAAYAEAKKRLLLRPELKTCIINADDATGRQWLQDSAITARKIAFSLQPDSLTGDIDRITVSQIHYHAQGCTAKLHTFAGDGVISAPLLGPFNLQNLLAAVAVLLARGIALDAIIQAANTLRAVDGRMEAVRQGGWPLVVIDYAHTPDALAQALKALRPHCQGQLWCVFGCGGDRDTGKRPEMGAMAEQWADRLVVTNDNPRSEPPQAIADAILAGCRYPEQIAVELTRTDAIRSTLLSAAADDVVLLAGKGHETYQEFADGCRPYSEMAAVRNVFNERQA